MERLTFVMRALAGALMVAILLPTVARAAERAHAHGVVYLNVAVDAGTVTLALEAPLDSLVGFEHAPRTAAQKKAVQAMLEKFKAPQSLFALPPAAQCSLKTSSTESDALGADDGKPAKAQAKSGAEHADLDGNFVFECKQGGAVDSIDLGGLLTAFPRISRVDAVIVTPSAQFKRALKRSQKVLRWGR
jgi:hypothetical protein